MKRKRGNFFAIAGGQEEGVFYGWEQASRRLDGCASFCQKFRTKEEGRQWLKTIHSRARGDFDYLADFNFSGSAATSIVYHHGQIVHTEQATFDSKPLSQAAYEALLFTLNVVLEFDEGSCSGRPTSERSVCVRTHWSPIIQQMNGMADSALDPDIIPLKMRIHSKGNLFKNIDYEWSPPPNPCPPPSSFFSEKFPPSIPPTIILLSPDSPASPPHSPQVIHLPDTPPPSPTSSEATGSPVSSPLFSPSFHSKDVPSLFLSPTRTSLSPTSPPSLILSPTTPTSPASPLSLTLSPMSPTQELKPAKRLKHTPTQGPNQGPTPPLSAQSSSILQHILKLLEKAPDVVPELLFSLHTSHKTNHLSNNHRRNSTRNKTNNSPNNTPWSPPSPPLPTHPPPDQKLTRLPQRQRQHRTNSPSPTTTEPKIRPTTPPTLSGAPPSPLPPPSLHPLLDPMSPPTPPSQAFFSSPPLSHSWYPRTQPPSPPLLPIPPGSSLGVFDSPLPPSQPSSFLSPNLQGSSVFEGGGTAIAGNTLPQQIKRCDFPRWLDQRKYHLSEEQIRAATLVCEMGRNTLITGSGGVGKSFLLRLIIDFFKDLFGEKYSEAVAVCGSTGIAASHIGGCTLHSALGIGVPNYLCDFNRAWKRKSTIRKLEVFIIDEISMISGEMLDAVFQKLKEIDGFFLNRCQVVFCGDFFQLPPIETSLQFSTYNDIAWKYFEKPGWIVSKTGPHSVQKNRGQVTKEDQLFLNRGPPFTSVTWLEIDPIYIELKQNFRQKDSHFVDILNRIRKGVQFDSDIFLINHKTPKELDGEELAVSLYPMNAQAEQENFLQLRQIKSKKYEYFALDGVRLFSDRQFDSRSQRDVSEDLFHSGAKTFGALVKPASDFKLGGRVMLLKNVNLKAEVPLVNGSIGEVIGWIQGESAYEIVSKRLESLDKKIRQAREEELQMNRDMLTTDNIRQEIMGMMLRMWLLDLLESDPEVHKELLEKYGIEKMKAEVFGVQTKFHFIKKKQCNNPVRFPLVQFRRNVMEPKEGKEGGMKEVIKSVQIPILPLLFSSEVVGVGVCYRLHIPLKTAYALTMHKSQGITLESAKVSPERVFEEGQTYVALSRVTSLQSLHLLTPLCPSQIRPPPFAVLFDSEMTKWTKTMRELSSALNDPSWLQEGVSSSFNRLNGIETNLLGSQKARAVKRAKREIQKIMEVVSPDWRRPREEGGTLTYLPHWRVFKPSMKS